MCYQSNSQACTISISFCGALPLSLGTECYGAAICQYGTKLDGSSSYSYSMGLYSTAKYAASKLTILFVDELEIIFSQARLLVLFLLHKNKIYALRTLG